MQTKTTLSKAYLLLIVIVVSAFIVRCKSDTSPVKLFDYNSLLVNRSNGCDAFNLISTNSSNDTFFINYETPSSYINELALTQHFQFLTQDIIDSDFLTASYISCNFNYPKREQPIIINKTNTIKSIKKKLERFENEKFRKTINKIYQLDSEYNYYDLIEILNIQYALADEKINQKKFDLFGKDVFELIYNLSIDCKNKTQTSTPIKNAIIESMKSNEELGQIMVQETEEVLNALCE